LKENEIKENTFNTLVSLKSVYYWKNRSMPKSYAKTLANPNVIKKSIGKLAPKFQFQQRSGRANQENNEERKMFIVKKNEMISGKMDRSNNVVSRNLNGEGGTKLRMNPNLAEVAENKGCRQSQEESARLARERIQVPKRMPN
jgi:hypothetical protein